MKHKSNLQEQMQAHCKLDHLHRQTHFIVTFKFIMRILCFYRPAVSPEVSAPPGLHKEREEAAAEKQKLKDLKASKSSGSGWYSCRRGL